MSGEEGVDRDRHFPPDGAEYWERLADRIERAAAERRASAVLPWLGAHALGIGAISVAAAALLFVGVLAWPADREPVAMARGAEWVRALTPADSLGRTLAVERPPSLGAVILAGSRNGSRQAAGRAP